MLEKSERVMRGVLVQSRMAVVSGTVEQDRRHQTLELQEKEERKLSEMMIPKKKRQLYSKIMFGNKRRTKEVRVTSGMQALSFCDVFTAQTIIL